MLRRPFATIDPALIHTVRLKVSFADLDPMGVVYHGNYARYFEAARSELFARLHWGYNAMKEAGFAFPVVDMETRFTHSATFGDTIEVKVGVLAWDPKLVTVYEIRLFPSGKLLTRAQIVQAGVDTQTKTLLFEAPDVMKERFLAALQHNG